MLRFTFLLSILLGLLMACSNKEERNLEPLVKAYYTTYQERTNFEKFLQFYSEEIVLEDIISGEKIVGKKAFKEFFNWDNPDFSLIEPAALIIEEQLIKGNKVVTKGYFTPFKWGNSEYEAMHFTTILTFDTKNKIIKQVDWINYPSNLINYEKRKNSNDWIK